MRELTLDGFAELLSRLAVAEPVALHAGLERVAEHIEHEAKAEIGHYQRSNMGPMTPWTELADSTKADRVSQGYPENEPLLRDGDLRDSISHEVGALEAVIGSDSDIAVYQELGTEHIPPRPFLGTAAHRSRKQVAGLTGAAAVAGILGKDQIAPALGYDFEVERLKDWS